MGFFSSLGDTYHLIAQSLIIIKRNPALFAPTLRELFWGAFLFILALIGVGGYVAVLFIPSTAVVTITLLGTDFVYSAAGITALTTTAVQVLGVLLLFLYPLVKTYYRAAQSWMVYETFTGKEGTFKSGIARARKNMGDILAITLLDVIFSQLAARMKKGNRGGGIIGIILAIVMFLVGRFIEEAWDLVGHYLLPATIVEEKNIVEAIPSLKNMKNNIPGALVGVFGIDFVGDIARGALTLVLFLLLLGAVFIGAFFNLWWVTLLLILFYVGIYIFTSVFIDMIKTIYFTLFYVSVNRPGEIIPEYREEVTSYLLFHEGKSSTDKGTTASQPSKDTPELIAQITPYINQYRAQGMTDGQILELLKRYEWPESVVTKALKQA